LPAVFDKRFTMLDLLHLGEGRHRSTQYTSPNAIIVQRGNEPLFCALQRKSDDGGDDVGQSCNAAALLLLENVDEDDDEPVPQCCTAHGE
jgi:xanthine/CO dehydrogenase XdhC/CoxF family maturation factor